MQFKTDEEIRFEAFKRNVPQTLTEASQSADQYTAEARGRFDTFASEIYPTLAPRSVNKFDKDMLTFYEGTIRKGSITQQAETVDFLRKDFVGQYVKTDLTPQIVKIAKDPDGNAKSRMEAMNNVMDNFKSGIISFGFDAVDGNKLFIDNREGMAKTFLSNLPSEDLEELLLNETKSPYAEITKFVSYDDVEDILETVEADQEAARVEWQDNIKKKMDDMDSRGELTVDFVEKWRHEFDATTYGIYLRKATDTGQNPRLDNNKRADIIAMIYEEPGIAREMITTMYLANPPQMGTPDFNGFMKTIEGQIGSSSTRKDQISTLSRSALKPPVNPFGGGITESQENEQVNKTFAWYELLEKNPNATYPELRKLFFDFKAEWEFKAAENGREFYPLPAYLEPGVTREDITLDMVAAADLKLQQEHQAGRVSDQELRKLLTRIREWNRILKKLDTN